MTTHCIHNPEMLTLHYGKSSVMQIQKDKGLPFKWLSSSLSVDCGCHLIMLLSDHATTRAGNPKSVKRGRIGEYSGE